MTREEVAAWFTAVHGHPPFAWQLRLGEEVAARRWPAVVAAPTGAGKTAVIDLALLALALGPEGAERTAPMRIVFAVDRRVVVDQAHERAKRIRDVLHGSKAGIVETVRDGLARFDKDGLHVEALRGGLPREDDWALTPARPTVLSTTLDQLGSRLLFRGYGVSWRMAPVHAGLLGDDALLILDEAHLAPAFAATLAAIGADSARRVGETDGGLPRGRWAAVRLTATPGDEAGEVFRLSDDERREPSMAKRLGASKPARLELSPAKAGSDEHAQALADEAWRMGEDRPGATIAVVVNRVALARAVHGAIDGLGGAACRDEERDDGTRWRHPNRPEVILLTGRVRPVERDRLIARHLDRLAAGRQSRTSGPPLFVVATQCIEAGADFDLHGLVTQLAPLDALRQRFGRLNRLGQWRDAGAVILAAKDEIGAKADDPVYGDRARKAWAWLQAAAKDAHVDFGPDAMDMAIAAHPPKPEPAAPCPTLRDADVELLATTSPRPHPDPAIEPFLRGRIDVVPDVGVFWRADLAEDVNRWPAIVAAMPPRPGEVLQAPVWAVRRWLARSGAERARSGADDIPDLDSAEPPEETGSAADSARRALRWRGADHPDTQAIAPGEIRPGDVLAVPANYGGCDPFGWAPDDDTPVEDIADFAAEPFSGRALAVRLHPALFAGRLKCASPHFELLAWSGSAAAALLADDLAERQTLDALLDADGEPGLPAESIAALEQLRARGARLRLQYPYDAEDASTRLGLVLSARLAAGRALTGEGDSGSFLSRPVGLARHRGDVEATARAFARAAGLSATLVETLARAAFLHDDGKADIRFQTMLRTGTVNGEPLAKSGGSYDPAAAARAGVPKGWRHEALSVRLAAHKLESADDVDVDLALWLIGTHHGYGRPFFGRHQDEWDGFDRRAAEAGVDLAPGPGPSRLDFDWRGRDWPGLFAALRRRYGTWGIAYLEAVLRLADHRASEAEEA